MCADITRVLAYSAAADPSSRAVVVTLRKDGEAGNTCRLHMRYLGTARHSNVQLALIKW